VLEQSNFGKREGEGRERRQGRKERARHQVFLFERGYLGEAGERVIRYLF